MKKNSILLKRLTRVGGVSLFVVCVSAVVYSIISDIAADKALELTRARTQLSFKQTEVNTFTNQLENTKGAQAEFSKYLLTRNNSEFGVDVDAVKALLNRLRDELQLGQDLRLSLSNESVLTDPKLAALPHTVLLREGTKLTFNAMTDMHIYTFVDAMTKEMPGIVQVTGLRVTQKPNTTLDSRTLAMIGAGAKPELAEGELTFNWYNVQKKVTTEKRK